MKNILFFICGGSGDDEGYAVAAGANRYLYTVGEIDSSDMPVHNAHQPALSGGVDGYLVVVDPAQSGSASLVYATYIGAVSDKPLVCHLLISK